MVPYSYVVNWLPWSKNACPYKMQKHQIARWSVDCTIISRWFRKSFAPQHSFQILVKPRLHQQLSLKCHIEALPCIKVLPSIIKAREQCMGTFYRKLSGISHMKSQFSGNQHLFLGDESDFKRKGQFLHINKRTKIKHQYIPSDARDDNFRGMHNRGKCAKPYFTIKLLQWLEIFSQC